jgi:hypothetical protein
MAREIVKQSFNTYTEVSDVIQDIDFNWTVLSEQDRFTFCTYPNKTYYVNPLSPSIEGFFGPYKVFDLCGNVLATNNTPDIFTATESLFKYGTFIAYLKNEVSTYMLFVSKNAVTTPFIEEQIFINTPQKSTININNTTQQSIYYSYTSEPVEPSSLIEIEAGVIEVIQPTFAFYLFIRTALGPVQFNTSNTRTKVVNDYFLLVCPTNYTKAQAAKLTGNPISTIKDELDLFITI